MCQLFGGHRIVRRYHDVGLVVFSYRGLTKIRVSSEEYPDGSGSPLYADCGRRRCHCGEDTCWVGVGD